MTDDERRAQQQIEEIRERLRERKARAAGPSKWGRALLASYVEDVEALLTALSSPSPSEAEKLRGYIESYQLQLARVDEAIGFPDPDGKGRIELIEELKRLAERSSPSELKEK